MAYDIGPKIGIEGESEFRAAITNINQNIKTLGTEMKAVTSAYDKDEQSVVKLAAQAPEWGREFVDGLRRGIREGAAPLLQDMGNLREDLRGAFSGEMAAAQRRLDRSMAQLPRGAQEETAVRRRDWADQNAPLDYDALAQAVKRGLDGSVVSMSGRKVGQLITDYQQSERRAKGS